MQVQRAVPQLVRHLIHLKVRNLPSRLNPTASSRENACIGYVWLYTVPGLNYY